MPVLVKQKVDPCPPGEDSSDALIVGSKRPDLQGQPVRQSSKGESIVLTIATPFGSSLVQSQRLQRAVVSAQWGRIAQVLQSNVKDLVTCHESKIWSQQKTFRANERSNQLASAERREETER
jgi:hypothetical protein